MFSYNYQREIVNGLWNINNSEVVDSEGNVIPLARIIHENFPDKGTIYLAANEANVIIENEIGFDENEKVILDNIITNYKQGII